MNSRAARVCIVGLCLLGAARVFVGSAGLPLFNDVDEQGHFDVIHKYARGYWPVLPHEYWDQETADVQAMYGSNEFMRRPESYPGGVFRPPVWTWAASRDRDDYVTRTSAGYTRYPSHEAHAPPVYYLAGAAWYKLGRLAGWSGPHAAYWVRFLNVPLFAALIATAFLFCRAYFSGFVARAVPALLAFFPSTIFFSITSDAPSPLMVLLALWLLLRWEERTSPSIRLSILVGLVAAAAFLVKLPNVMILATCGLVVVWRWYREHRSGTLRAEWLKGALLLLATSLPVGCWVLQNKLLLGDFTGTSPWVQQLGWSRKPIAEIFNHPLFSVGGQKIFWGRLLTNFYVGDMNWHGSPTMKFLPSDFFFVASFALLPIALGMVWFRHRPAAAVRFPAAGVLCALFLAGSVMFLIAQSLLWDFGAGVYPSREYPYLSSGRLISGAIVPFLVLYACSVEALFRRWKPVGASILALSVTMMIVPQTTFLREVVESRYNWFHLFAPGSESDAHTGLGLIALDRGRIDEAATNFSRASDLQPSNIAALANLGLISAAQGKNEQAARAFTRALNFQPESSELYNSRGVVFAAEGNWEEAVKDYRESARLSPQAPFYRFPLAHALSKTGHGAESGLARATALQSAKHWPRRSARIERVIPAHPDPEVRMWLAARAVQLAEQTRGADGVSRLELLEDLAVAYSAAGRSEETIATADQAILAAEEGGEHDLAARLRGRLDKYQERIAPH